MYGSSSGFYLPGDPDTASIADREFKVDATGGATVLVWPRNLSNRDQRRVFRYARKKGWAIRARRHRGQADLGERTRPNQLQRVGHQLGAHVVGHRPADDPPRVDVLHRDEIHRSLLQPPPPAFDVA